MADIELDRYGDPAYPEPPDCVAMADGTAYGLTCGFWTDKARDIDAHVLRYHRDGPDVYDLCEYHR